MDRTRTQWALACIAASLLSGCGSISPEPRLPALDGRPLARPALVPDSILAVSKAVPDAGSQIVRTAQATPRVSAAPPPAAPPDPPVDPAAERARAQQQALQAWLRAWQERNAEAYFGAYAASYKASAQSRQAWERAKKRHFAAGPVAVRISEVKWNPLGDDEAEVRFLQHYEQGRYRDVGDKTLRLRRIDGDWRITQESWRVRRGG
jgi:hypothetical protein